jgi:DNA-directed RNA polymerase specialized sigma24 family protein
MAAGGMGEESGSCREHGTGPPCRICADAALVDRLAAARFSGHEYEVLRRRLAELGFVVLLGQIRTGEIFRACHRARRPVFPRGDELHRLASSPDDRAALATDAAMGGLDLFCREGLVQGGWRRDGGAALDTYFLGACVLTFPQVFRTWRRDRDRELDCRSYGSDPATEPALLARPAVGLGPVAFVELVEELAAMPPVVRYAAVHIIVLGRSHAEIAADLGITAAALGERLRRYRLTRRHPRREDDR